MVLIITCGLIQSQLYDSQLNVDPALWFSGFIMPLLGYFLGNIFGAMFCLKMKECRTIGFETGMQNAGVALTSIALSYDESEAMYYVQFPIIYSTWMIVDGITIVVLHWIYFTVKERRTVCQRNKDKRSKNLKNIDDDNMSVSSASSDESYGVPQFIERIKPVDMGVGKFIIKEDGAYQNGVIATITIGEDSPEKTPEANNYTELVVHDYEKIDEKAALALSGVEVHM